MIQITSFDLVEIRQAKIRFWLNWTIANALGMSIGWCLGEYIGQIALKSYSIRISTLIAALVFELILWSSRLLPSRYFSKQRPIKLLDGVIWFGTEIFGWIVFSFIESRSQWLTFEVIFITGMGVTFWILFAAFGLLQIERKQNPPEWFSKAFIYVLVGFVLGNSFVMGIMTTAMSIGYSLVKIVNPYMGWGIAGLFLGGAFGAITGVILVRSIDWLIQLKVEEFNKIHY
jgi:hypothetical protein